MEKIRYMVTFAHVVKAGSFVGGAEKLDLAPPVASKHVAKLEKALGVKLLNRTTRSLSMTEAGAAYFQHCERILEELEQSEQAVASLQAEPHGRLRITAPNSITNSVLVPLIPDFLAKYPQVELEIVNSEHIVDLVEEGYDVALRITNEPAPQLVARRLFPVTFRVMASPAYLQRYGTPKTPADLAGHMCLNYPQQSDRKWVFRHHGQRVEADVHSPVQINSIDALRRLVLAGVGLALLPVSANIRELRSGKLVCLLPEYSGFSDNSHLHVVYLQNRYGSPKVKAFVEYVTDYARGLNIESYDCPDYRRG